MLFVYFKFIFYFYFVFCLVSVELRISTEFTLLNDGTSSSFSYVTHSFWQRFNSIDRYFTNNDNYIILDIVRIANPK